MSNLYSAAATKNKADARLTLTTQMPTYRCTQIKVVAPNQRKLPPSPYSSNLVNRRGKPLLLSQDLRGVMLTSSAAAQIAAMEAKLASLQSRKPADEDYVPGQGIDSKFNAPPRNLSAAPSREGSASASPGPEVDLDEEMGLDAATKAADELEREFGLEIAGRGEMSGDATPARVSLPLGEEAEVDEKEKTKQDAFNKGLAGLPKKPSFL